ncbi:hypothetical protein [Mycobacterium avium]|nr:hypothetical protein [Mycobacterium avium]
MAVGDYEWFITLAELQHVTAAAEGHVPWSGVRAVACPRVALW